MRPQLSISHGLTLSLLLVNTHSVWAQTSPQIQSPKEVLQAYRKMDAEGGRLTATGWRRASKYFVRPGQWLRYRAIEVIWGETDPYVLGQVTERSAELAVRCEAVGQIDSTGTFTYTVAPSLIDSSGSPAKRHPTMLEMHGPKAPLDRPYDLVFTDTYWEFGPGSKDLREVKGSPEWRIAHFEYQPWVTIQTAIRYLTQLRDESSSDKIKSNAEKSIAILQRVVAEHR